MADGMVGAVAGVVARIWIFGPGDICHECPMRTECADQTRCLHLVKSAGLSTRIDGEFRRFPLGAREVGRVPVTLEPVVVNDHVGELGFADHTWLMLHEVRAFAAVPIEFEEHCLGVAAVFAKDEIDAARLTALQSLATLAAGAVARSETGKQEPSPAAAPTASPAPAVRGEARDGVPYLRPLDDTERDVIERVLDHTHGRVSGPLGAAVLLGIKPTTLHSRMKKLGVARTRSKR